MLEIEGCVVGPSPPLSPGRSASAAAAAAPLDACGSEAICRKLAHAFPWSPAARVHLALAALRRRARTGYSTPMVDFSARIPDDSVTVLMPRQPQKGPAAAAASHRKFLIRVCTLTAAAGGSLCRDGLVGFPLARITPNNWNLPFPSAPLLVATRHA